MTIRGTQPSDNLHLLIRRWEGFYASGRTGPMTTESTTPTNDKNGRDGRRDIARAVTRIAHEILERNKGIPGSAPGRDQDRGVHLAHRPSAAFMTSRGPRSRSANWTSRCTGRPLAAEGSTDPPTTSVLFKISDLKVVLVDDVLFTGRTIRRHGRTDDLGRPAEIQLAVLVDRGHRQLPIKANYRQEHSHLARRGHRGPPRRKRGRGPRGHPQGVTGDIVVGLKRKDLLSLTQLSADDISPILETADSFKEVSGREIKKVPALRGKTVVNLFSSPAREPEPPLNWPPNGSVPMSSIFALFQQRRPGERCWIPPGTSKPCRRISSSFDIPRQARPRPWRGRQVVGDQCRRRVARTSDAGPAGSVHDSQPGMGFSGTARGDRRGCGAQPRGPLEHFRPHETRRRSAGRGPPTMIPLHISQLGVQVYHNLDDGLRACM